MSEENKVKFLELLDALQNNAFWAGDVARSLAYRHVMDFIKDENYLNEMWKEFVLNEIEI